MHNNILHELLQKLDVQFSENGGAVYTCQGMDIQLQADSNGQNIYLFYCVGTWPEQPSTTFTKKILHANFFGAITKGGHLGLYEENKTLIYSLRLTADTLDIHSLQNALHLFATTALELMQHIATWQGDAQPEGQGQEKQSSAPATDLHSLIQLASMRV